MRKYLWIFLCLIILIAGGIFIFNINNNSKENYIAKRSVANVNKNNTFYENIEITKPLNIIEEQLSEFTTKLPNDTEARDGNIKLACQTLSGTIVKKEEEFSLWKILGCPSAETGYEKAKTFTSNGEVTQSYGGGICQLSTTLYNAVLNVDGLKVTERHEHSRDVPYIKDGKDAAVSYGSADFKFKNNLNYNIRIEAEVADRNVKVSLVKIPE